MDQAYAQGLPSVYKPIPLNGGVDRILKMKLINPREQRGFFIADILIS